MPPRADLRTLIGMQTKISDTERLTAVAARVMRENPQLDAHSVQEGVNAALQEVYRLTFERQLQWRAGKNEVSRSREKEAQSLGQLVFQLHGG